MPHDLYLKSVIAYVENHITEPLSAKELAQVAGYDEDYFRRIFKDATGDSIARYVRHRRLNHAAFALRNSQRSIVDIACSYGFSSHDAFSRAFRRLVNCTPSDFRHSRKVVKGVYITPGQLGPSIIDEEMISMIQKQENIDSVVLYGVPRVTYFNDPPELTPFISSLRACLTYTGQAISYARLMAGSGAAFRLMWNTKHWDGGNVDIMCMRPDAFGPIRRAFDTAGRKYTLIERSEDEGNKEAMKMLIKKELDAGRPVIGFGVIGPPEACVITGYREDGEVLLGWSYFQEFPEWRSGLEFEDCGYFIRRGWYEHRETKGVMAVGEPQEKKDEKAFLRDTLMYALKIMETEKVGDMAGSQQAYDAWRDGLLDDSEFPERAPLPMLMERLMCHGDAFTMVAEGRAYAGVFFKEEAEKFEEYACELMTISELFKREHETAFGMSKYVPLGMSEDSAKALATRKNREAIAKIIDKCKKLDRQAWHMIKELLKTME